MLTQRTVTIVLVVLGVVAVIGLVLIGVLAMRSLPIPAELAMPTAGAIGTVGGVLINPRNTK